MSPKGSNYAIGDRSRPCSGEEGRECAMTVNPRKRKRASHTGMVAVVLGLTLSLSGCVHTMGPRLLTQDRALYSASLSDSWKEQTLLNIVKTRYFDPPVFVDIGNIVSSYSLSESGSIGGSISPGGSSGASLGAGATFNNSPTITYAPMTGSKFINSLMAPLPIGAVFAGIQDGLPADTMMFAAVSSINGLKNQEAHLDGIKRADSSFHRVRELVRRIQLEGAVKTYVKMTPDKHEVTILAFHTRDVPPETLDDITELRHLLHLSPDATEFTVVQAAHSSSDTEIAVMTRSILSLMQTMAAQVEVPSEDLQQTRAFPGFEKEHGNPQIVRLIQIHSDKSRSPYAFVSVYYRDYWFWIDDRDLESKQVFSLMMMLFTMSDSSVQASPPVITIPAHN